MRNIFFLLPVLLMPITLWAKDSHIESHGYDLDLAYEFFMQYMPKQDILISFEPSQLPVDVRTKADFVKKFKVRADVAQSDKIRFADACDEMISYFHDGKLTKMTFNPNGWVCD